MKEVNKIYLASFLQGFGVVASVTYTLFFLSNGLTQTQIGILFSFFIISLALLEIPTGAFADTIGYKSSIALGTSLTVSNKRLLAFVLITIALTTIRLVFNQNISQPYLLSVGISISFIGILAAIVSVILAGIHAYTYKVSQKIGDIKSLLLMIGLPSLSAIILGFLYSPLAILFLILFQIGHAYKEPVLARLTHKELHDENRATMASTTSFLSGIIVGLFLPIWGNVIDTVGLHTTSIYIGLSTLVVGVIAIFLYSCAKNPLLIEHKKF